MKYRLPNDEQPESPIDVRLVHGTCPKGIQLQVKKGIGNVWAPILTLTEDGVLALWDINKKDLANIGLDMSGYRASLNDHDHISLRIA